MKSSGRSCQASGGSGDHGARARGDHDPRPLPGAGARRGQATCAGADRRRGPAGPVHQRDRQAARRLGPALYRYFAGRDALLTELVVDAYRDLAAALTDAATGAADRPAGERFAALARAYRRGRSTSHTATGCCSGRRCRATTPTRTARRRRAGRDGRAPRRAPGARAALGGAATAGARASARALGGASRGGRRARRLRCARS